MHTLESHAFRVVCRCVSADTSTAVVPATTVGEWVAEYDEHYNVVYRNSVTGELHYYNPSETYVAAAAMLTV